MRPRTLLPFALAALVGATVAVLPAFAAPPAEVKLEVNENCVQANWPCWAPPGAGPNPEPAFKVTIAAGGEVKFADNASTAATVSWTGTGTGSAPTCSGVPASAMTKWEGTCKFEQPGTYKFESSTLFNAGPSLNYTKYEVVVESTGIGTTPTLTTTVAPTTTTTTTPTPPGEPGYGSPLEGRSSALKLAGSQRGASVHGSINVPQVDAGGRLEVSLFTAGASPAKTTHPVKVRVGRLVRSSLEAGSVSFSVPLNAKGKAGLRRHRRLALTVKIALTPLHGAAIKVTRGVVIHV
jgi:hypothetical protein